MNTVLETETVTIPFVFPRFLDDSYFNQDTHELYACRDVTLPKDTFQILLKTIKNHPGMVGVEFYKYDYGSNLQPNMYRILQESNYFRNSDYDDPEFLDFCNFGLQAALSRPIFDILGPEYIPLNMVIFTLELNHTCHVITNRLDLHNTSLLNGSAIREYSRNELVLKLVNYENRPDEDEYGSEDGDEYYDG